MNRLLEFVIEIFTSPSEHALEIVILILTLSLLAGIVAAILIAVFASRRREVARVKLPKTYQAISISSQGLFIFLLVFFAVLIGSLAYGSRQSTCISCHGKEYTINHVASVHQKVSCFSCHQKRDVGSVISYPVRYARWVVSFYINSKDETNQSFVTKNLTSLACQNCHKEIYIKTIRSRKGIKVRHSDFIKSGNECLRCHGTSILKTGQISKQTPSMEYCAPCHSKNKKMVSCSLCHFDVPGDQKKASLGDRLTLPPPDDCRPCHYKQKNDSCYGCHGLEMPHPAEFRNPYVHARPGFKDKRLCFRCHGDGKGGPGYRTCNECHRFPSLHEPWENWLTLHGPAAYKQISYRKGQEYCQNTMCHGNTLRDFCKLCHEDKAERGIQSGPPCHASGNPDAPAGTNCH